MNKKLIFLDIDGTLTVPGTNVPPASALAAVAGARRAGHRVLLCSGRNYDMLRPLLGCGFDGAVASAGGYVLLGDRVLFDCPMTPEQFRTLFALLGEQGVFRTLECRDATFCDPGVADFLAGQAGGSSEVRRWRTALEERLGFRPVSEYAGQPVYKFVVMCRSARQLRPAREAMEAEFRFLIHEDDSRGTCGGELINRRFSKGTGVRLVAEALGVPLADTVGFGDSMNDREMLETVGFSVCMGNGSPELKALSRLVCPRVEEDGLAAAFRELGLTE